MNAPLIDRSKLLVLTDRGQIKVLDIQAAAEKNKVSVIASEVASENKPIAVWGVTENDQLWLTSYRFMRWDIQVSTGKLVRPWIMDDGDQFVGPPLKFDDIIVHRRIVRGNRGVRVAPSKPIALPCNGSSILVCQSLDARVTMRGQVRCDSVDRCPVCDRCLADTNQRGRVRQRFIQARDELREPAIPRKRRRGASQTLRFPIACWPTTQLHPAARFAIARQGSAPPSQLLHLQLLD